MTQQLANIQGKIADGTAKKTRQDNGTADGTTVLTDIIMKHGPFSRREPKYQPPDGNNSTHIR